MPNINTLLDRLAGATILSTLDVASAFWSIPLDDASKPKTSFQAGNSSYQFRVMPFGLSGGPATYQRLI